MSRLISRAEAWEKAYESFQEINFTAFDYETIKQSMIDYVKLYFPEEFNDYIESSEFIAILELFAYLGELLAYRLDMNAHENFLSTAQRKQSVLRLAKLISYNPSRNIPARGLVKITSISTSQDVYDADGTNLANTTIVWNDPSNSKWKEQFLLVMDKFLAQPFGTVSPNDRIQVDDILFELYQLNHTTASIPTAVVPYSVAVSGTQYPMELVPVSLTENGPTERRPEFNVPMTILYGNDGLGDASDTSGFFFYTKQGQIQTYTYTFDGITPNQIVDLDPANINETDVWLNNVDPDTLEILDDGSVPNQRSGEWQQVDIANAQNIIFNTNENRNKFEVETLEDDQIRIIFGDGEFATVPSGTFHFWIRTSANENLVIPLNTIVDEPASFTYLDEDNITRTFNLTFTQISTIQNASVSEDIENIRRVAPSVYYSQDRMVNGRDYNTFMLQDPSILKLRAVNRTFAGESKYAPWNDPSGAYDNVKLFGDDLSIYYQTTPVTIDVNEDKNAEALLNDNIEPLLSNIDIYATLVSILPNKQPPNRQFTATGAEYILNGGGPVSGIFLGLNSLNGGDKAVLLYADYESRGYQRPVITGGVYPDTLTNLLPSTGYSFNITVDGVGPTLVAITTPAIGSGPFGEIVYSDLITEINNEFTSLLLNAEVVIEGNWLKFYSNTFGPTSTILLADVSLFGTLANFAGLETPVAGLPSGSGTYWDVVDGNAFANIDAALGTYPNAVFLVTRDPAEDAWVIEYVATQLIVESADTNFYHVNDGTITVTYDTLLSNTDLITVLAANPDKDRTGILNQNVSFEPISHVLIPAPLPNQGLPNLHQLQIMTRDVDEDGVPDNFDAPILFNPSVSTTVTGTVTLPIYYVNGMGDITVTGDVDNVITYTEDGVAGDVVNSVTITNLGANAIATVTVRDYVYFFRADPNYDLFAPIEPTVTNIEAFVLDSTNLPEDRNYKRLHGRFGLNFLWQHRASTFNLVDPAASNIIDIFLITRGYYTNFKGWINGLITIQPDAPTPLQLRSDYADLLDNKMISDTVILHPGKFKILFGSKASAPLQAKFKIIRSSSNRLTDNQIKVSAVTAIRNFFDVSKWEFGETFYFTELAAEIHNELAGDIDSVVLVPLQSNNVFGDLFQVHTREDEIFIPHVTVDDIEIVTSYNPENIKQRA